MQIEITNWTHEDVSAMFTRVIRQGLEGAALQAVTRSICMIQPDTNKDAVRMEIWRADRTKQTGWGDLVSTPAESASTDLKVLSTQREIKLSSYYMPRGYTVALLTPEDREIMNRIDNRIAHRIAERIRQHYYCADRRDMSTMDQHEIERPYFTPVGRILRDSPEIV